MPIKRRASKHRDHSVTATAVSAYRAGDWIELHRALGLKPWHSSPLDVAGDPPTNLSGAQFERWTLATDLRAELEQASAAYAGLNGNLG